MRCTPVEETLGTLDDLVRAGKLRYIGVSNFSGWHLMKSLAVSERYGLARYVANQAYYSLVGRDYEWELMPLAQDQGVGAVVWSPLGWGRLTGKIRRGQPRCLPIAACTSLPTWAEVGEAGLLRQGRLQQHQRDQQRQDFKHRAIGQHRRRAVLPAAPAATSITAASNTPSPAGTLLS